jgi:hypothetical protein
VLKFKRKFRRKRVNVVKWPVCRSVVVIWIKQRCKSVHCVGYFCYVCNARYEQTTRNVKVIEISNPESTRSGDRNMIVWNSLSLTATHFLLWPNTDARSSYSFKWETLLESVTHYFSVTWQSSIKWFNIQNSDSGLHTQDFNFRVDIPSINLVPDSRSISLSIFLSLTKYLH